MRISPKTQFRIWLGTIPHIEKLANFLTPLGAELRIVMLRVLLFNIFHGLKGVSILFVLFFNDLNILNVSCHIVNLFSHQCLRLAGNICIALLIAGGSQGQVITSIKQEQSEGLLCISTICGRSECFRSIFNKGSDEMLSSELAKGHVGNQHFSAKKLLSYPAIG